MISVLWSTSGYASLYACVIFVFCNLFHNDVRYQVSVFDETKERPVCFEQINGLLSFL